MSRERARQECRHECGICGFQFAGEQERWISVEERLPTENDAYLIVEIGDLDAEAADWFDGEWRSVRSFGRDCEERILHNVTHWMEMPKAPAPPDHKGGS